MAILSSLSKCLVTLNFFKNNSKTKKLNLDQVFEMGKIIDSFETRTNKSIISKLDLNLMNYTL